MILRKKKLIDGYNKTAESYDELYFNEQMEKYKFALKALDFSLKGRRIGDFGCGTGLFLKAINPEVELVGVDFSLKSLQLAREKGYRHVVLADIEKPPFRKHVFDAIFLFTVIHHLYSPIGTTERLVHLSKRILVLSVLKKDETEILVRNLLNKFRKAQISNSSKVKDVIFIIRRSFR